MGIHYMDATTVEECWRLLRQTGKSNSYESLANLPRYSRWLQGQDWTDAYARHKANLQLVGLNDPEKRWILKNPSHMTALRKRRFVDGKGRRYIDADVSGAWQWYGSSTFSMTNSAPIGTSTPTRIRPRLRSRL